MNFLELTNKVLIRLREDTVTATNSTDYSTLIAEFVNQAMYDVEHAWDWNCLKETITITTAASDDLYDFHNADTKIIEGINETRDFVMRVIPAAYQHRLEYLNTSVSDSPYFYSLLSKNGDYSQLKLYPTPSAVESLRFLCIKHTPAYLVDTTDDASELTVPDLPVILGAYALAVSERGEDGGIGFAEADQRANIALADAISLDCSMGHPCETSWNAY